MMGQSIYLGGRERCIPAEHNHVAFLPVKHAQEQDLGEPDGSPQVGRHRLCAKNKTKRPREMKVVQQISE